MRLILLATGVATNEQGYIKVDQYQNTNVEGIYCVGDIMEGGIELTPWPSKRVVSCLSVCSTTNLKRKWIMI
ncbi:FAD-dependent oxidoreductase [Vibrio metschnikovii]